LGFSVSPAGEYWFEILACRNFLAVGTCQISFVGRFDNDVQKKINS